jgi:cob(I)alamin adenosyltransferase
MMVKENIELVLGTDEQEEARVHAIVTQAIQRKAAVFVGRFLRDMALTKSIVAEWRDSNIMLRQYGHSCFVNAYPPLADAGRIEIGLDEAEVALHGGQYDIVLLSQILTAIDERLLTSSDIARLVQVCPDRVTLILTGRNAPEELVAQCESCQQEAGR